jgi:Na+/H+ antiporter NhaD/arsenite permease-like protein
MLFIVILIFIIGYLFIVFEHPLKLDKTVSALLMGALSWTVLSLGYNSGELSIIDAHQHIHNTGGQTSLEFEENFTNVLLHHLGKIAEILIFLIGAMTIVELIDMHQGFHILKQMVNTKSKKRLLWIIGILSFFLSAIIDNLTTVIVIITLLRKIIKDPKERMYFSALAIITANAGGAWTPIGDVTTTMLWMSKKVTAMGLIEWVSLPALACFLVPFFIASFLPIFNGVLNEEKDDDDMPKSKLQSSTMLWLGLGSIVFVPIFKSITNLPPYIGMMLSLGMVWLVSEYIHPDEEFQEDKKNIHSAHLALSRIDISSVLFFLGILLVVASLETMVIDNLGTLRFGAGLLETFIPNKNMVIILLGFFSAVIDNVPLVAASIGMFNEPIDDKVWHFIAFTAGTGGSMLIIGSAAGVAAMGMEKINFIWYLKKISWLAFIGYIAGVIVFLIQDLIIY